MIRSDAKGARIRVAVLGGGAGALSTALALTDPALEERYEVTVYQMGWRLGGKGASGRNAAFDERIEEHGIHVWFGFYDNAFRLLRSCYDTLRASGWVSPTGAPCAIDHVIDEVPGKGAFYPHEHFVVNELRSTESGDNWSKWNLYIPSNGLTPGNADPVAPEKSLAFTKAVEMLASVTEVRKSLGDGVAESLGVGAGPDVAPDQETKEEQVFRRFVSQRTELEGTTAPLGPEDFLRQALDGIAAPALDESLAVAKNEGLLGEDARFALRLRFTAWALRNARRLLRLWDRGDKGHRLYLACDTFAAVATGLSADVFDGDRDPSQALQELNQYDLREWLAKHGADPTYLMSNPTVRFIYNSAFAFENGDHNKPRIAAGSALRGVLQLFLGYKGAFAYRLSSGMGDVVFSPIYEVLRGRKVRFEFFHRVDALQSADNERGEPVIREVHLTRQAQLKDDGGEYAPLRWVADFPCWPSEPDWAQLRNGEALRAEVQAGRLDLEAPRELTGVGSDEKPRVLRAGEDFDEVVLAIPVAALGAITTSLADHREIGPTWRRMLAETATTPTQAFQVWFRGSLRDLKWDGPPPVFGTFVEPIDTYIDMSPALALEKRRHDDVKSLAYFCGVIDRIDGETKAAADERAFRNAVAHLTEHGTYFWPALKESDRFEWRFLWGAGRGEGSPLTRFKASQYARANVLPSELYTLNLPNSSQYRLPPDAANDPKLPFWRNLSLGGDWTRNPINLGCVEATVMTGLMAARGIVSRCEGEAAASKIQIIGESADYVWRSLGRGSRVLSYRENVAAPGEDGGTTGDLPAGGPPADVWGEGALDRLDAALNEDDRPATEALCAGLSQRLAAPGPTISDSPTVAKQVLSRLRKKRYFDVVQQVADAFLQAGTDTPAVRREYAQALIDQGMFGAAQTLLGDLKARRDLTEDDKSEVSGLMGRLFKQRYVNAPGVPDAGDALLRAVASYVEGYRIGTDPSYHAVNIVALAARAKKDGVMIDGALDGLNATELSEEVLRRIEEKPNGKMVYWDYASAAEANLALANNDGAIDSFRMFGAAKNIGAFDIASPLRQVLEVWQLSRDKEPGMTIIPRLEAELLKRQGGRLDVTAAQLRAPRSNLQKQLGSEDARTFAWYQEGLERCRLVARITDRFEQGGGTGFLVRAGDFLKCDDPDELILMTNAHVLEPAPRERGTLAWDQAIVRFELERADAVGAKVHAVREILWSSARLDATLARLHPAPVGLVAAPLSKDKIDPKGRERLIAIGHPEGRALSLSLYDNRVLDADETYIHYRTPTKPGSSGSAMYNNAWQLVALHHAGSLELPRLNGKLGVYPANEGIRIDVIQRASLSPGPRS